CEGERPPRNSSEPRTAAKPGEDKKVPAEARRAPAAGTSPTPSEPAPPSGPGQAPAGEPPPPAEAAWKPPTAPAGARPEGVNGGPGGRGVWLESEGDKRRVRVRAWVCLRQGRYGLECLLCRRHTKEHESVLATAADASLIHAGLLATKA